MQTVVPGGAGWVYPGRSNQAGPEYRDGRVHIRGGQTGQARAGTVPYTVQNSAGTVPGPVQNSAIYPTRPPATRQPDNHHSGPRSTQGIMLLSGVLIENCSRYIRSLA